MSSPQRKGNAKKTNNARPYLVLALHHLRDLESLPCIIILQSFAHPLRLRAFAVRVLIEVGKCLH